MKVRSIEVRFVSPEEAAEFLKCNFAHQRFLRKHFVKSLVSEMESGRLLQTAEIHVVHYNGRQVMVNGQHTCSAIIKYGKAVEVTVRHTDVASEDEIALVYAYGHDNGLKRSPADALSAFNLSGRFAISKSQTRALSSAMRHIYVGFDWDKRDGGKIAPTPVTEIEDQMRHWVETMRAFDALPAPQSRVHKTVYQRSIYAVALVTMRFAPERAAEFWTGVFNPTGLVWEDPRAVCNRMLEKLISTPGGKTADIFVKSRMVAACWNAYWNDATLRKAPSIPQDMWHAPIKLLGTPYDGKQQAPWWPDTASNVNDAASADVPAATNMPGKAIKATVTMQEWLESTRRAA